MTDEFQGPKGPPWDVDVIADVHAGVYPFEQNEQLRRLIATDPQGAAVLAALDSTVDSLSLMPALTMPAPYVLRLDAALAAEYATLPAASSSLTAVTPAGAPAAAASGAVLRGGIGALLHPGPAQPGPARPGTGGTGTGGPNQAQPGPFLPRQADPVRHPHPPRRQPVIPLVLPGGSHRSNSPARPGANAAAGSGAAAESTAPAGSHPGGGSPDRKPAPANVTDLRSVATARNDGTRAPRSADRPTRPGGSTGPTRVGSLEAQRSKRRRWTGGLLAAAAVVAIGAVTAISLTSGRGEPVAGAPQASQQQTVTIAPGNGAGNEVPGNSDQAQALVLEPGKLGDSLDQIEGNTTPSGALANPATQAACLGANKIEFSKVTGITQVTYQGKPAYAIAVEQGTEGTKVDVVVVGLKCGVDGAADMLASQIVTR